MISKESLILLVVYALIIKNVNSKSMPHEINSVESQKLSAPSTGTECYIKYREAVQLFGRRAKTAHNRCEEISRNEILKAEAAYSPEAKSLAYNTNNPCNALFRCNQLRSAREAIKCIAAESSKYAAAMKAVSIDAYTSLADLTKQKRLIKIKEYKCTNNTEDKHYRSMSLANTNFIHCILGKASIPYPTEFDSEIEATEEAVSTGKSEATESVSETSDSVKNFKVTENRRNFKNNRNNDHNFINNSEDLRTLQTVKNPTEVETTEKFLTSRILKTPESHQIAENQRIVSISPEHVESNQTLERSIKLPLVSEIYHNNGRSTEHPIDIERAENHLPSQKSETAEILQNTESPTESSNRVKIVANITVSNSLQAKKNYESPSENFGVIEVTKKPDLRKKSQGLNSLQINEFPIEDSAEVQNTEKHLHSNNSESPHTNEIQAEASTIVQVTAKPDRFEKSEGIERLRTTESPKDTILDDDAMKHSESHQAIESPTEDSTVVEIIEKYEPVQNHDYPQLPDIPIKLPLVSESLDIYRRSTEDPIDVQRIGKHLPSTKYETAEIIQSNKSPTESLKRVKIVENHEVPNSLQAKKISTEFFDAKKAKYSERPSETFDVFEVTKNPDLMKKSQGLDRLQIDEFPIEDSAEVQTTEKHLYSKNSESAHTNEVQAKASTIIQVTAKSEDKEKLSTTESPKETIVDVKPTRKSDVIKHSKHYENHQIIESPTEDSTVVKIIEKYEPIKNPEITDNPQLPEIQIKLPPVSDILHINGRSTEDPIDVQRIEKHVPSKKYETAEILQSTESPTESSSRVKIVANPEVSNNIQAKKDSESSSESFGVIEDTKKPDLMKTSQGLDSLQVSEFPIEDSAEVQNTEKYLHSRNFLSPQINGILAEASTVVQAAAKPDHFEKTQNIERLRPTESPKDTIVDGNVMKDSESRQIIESPTEDSTVVEIIEKYESIKNPEITENPQLPEIPIKLTLVSDSLHINGRSTEDPIDLPSKKYISSGILQSTKSPAESSNRVKVVENIGVSNSLQAKKISPEYSSAKEAKDSESPSENEKHLHNKNSERPHTNEVQSEASTIIQVFSNSEDKERLSTTESHKETIVDVKPIRKSDVMKHSKHYESRQIIESPTEDSTVVEIIEKHKIIRNPEITDNSQPYEIPLKLPLVSDSLNVNGRSTEDPIDLPSKKSENFKSTESLTESPNRVKIVANPEISNSLPAKKISTESSNAIPLSREKAKDFESLSETFDVLEVTKKPDLMKKSQGFGKLQKKEFPIEDSVQTVEKHFHSRNFESPQISGIQAEASTIVQVTAKPDHFEKPEDIERLRPTKSPKDTIGNGNIIKHSESRQIIKGPTEDSTVVEIIEKYEPVKTPDITDNPQLPEIPINLPLVSDSRHIYGRSTEDPIDVQRIGKHLPRKKYETAEILQSTESPTESSNKVKIVANPEFANNPQAKKISTEPFNAKKAKYSERPSETFGVIEMTKKPELMKKSQGLDSLQINKFSIEDSAEDKTTGKHQHSKNSESPHTNKIHAEASTIVQVTAKPDHFEKPEDIERLRPTKSPKDTLGNGNIMKHSESHQIIESPTEDSTVVEIIERYEPIKKPEITDNSQLPEIPINLPLVSDSRHIYGRSTEDPIDIQRIGKHLPSKKYETAEILQSTESPPESFSRVKIVSNPEVPNSLQANKISTESSNSMPLSRRKLKYSKTQPKSLGFIDVTNKPDLTRKSQGIDRLQINEFPIEDSAEVQTTEKHLHSENSESPHANEIQAEASTIIQVTAKSEDIERPRTTENPKETIVDVKPTRKSHVMKHSKHYESHQIIESPTEDSTVVEIIEKYEPIKNPEITDNPQLPEIPIKLPLVSDSLHINGRSTEDLMDLPSKKSKSSEILQSTESPTESSSRVKIVANPEVSNSLQAKKDSESSSETFRVIEVTKKPDLMKKSQGLDRLQINKFPIEDLTEVQTNEKHLHSEKSESPQINGTRTEASTIIQVNAKSEDIERLQPTESPKENILDVKPTRKFDVMKHSKHSESHQDTESPLGFSSVASIFQKIEFLERFQTPQTPTGTIAEKSKIWKTPEAHKISTVNSTVFEISEKLEPIKKTDIIESPQRSKNSNERNKEPDRIKIPEIFESQLIRSPTKDPTETEITEKLDSIPNPEVKQWHRIRNDTFKKDKAFEGITTAESLLKNSTTEIIETTTSSSETPTENGVFRIKYQGSSHTTESPIEASNLFEVNGNTRVIKKPEHHNGLQTTFSSNEITTKDKPDIESDLIEKPEDLKSFQITESSNEDDISGKFVPRRLHITLGSSQTARSLIKTPTVINFTEKADPIIKYEILSEIETNKNPLLSKKHGNFEKAQNPTRTVVLVEPGKKTDFAELEHHETVQTTGSPKETTVVFKFTENRKDFEGPDYLQTREGPVPAEVESTEILRLRNNLLGSKSQLGSSKETGYSKKLQQLETPKVIESFTKASVDIKNIRKSPSTIKAENPEKTLIKTTIELVDIPYIIEVHKVPDSLQTTEYQPVTHALIDATNRQDHFNLHNKTKSPNEAPTGKLLNSKKNQDHEGRQESTAVEVTENNDPIKNFSAPDRSKNIEIKYKVETTETEVPTAIENTSERQAEAHVIKLTGSLGPLKETENHESEISFPAKDNHIRKTKISEKNSEVQISESPTETHDTEATIIKTETFEEPETNESANKVSTVFKIIEKHEPIQKLEVSESHQTSENRIAAVTAKPLPSKINQNFNQTTIELFDIPYIIEVHKVPDSLQTTEYQPVTHALIDATNRQDHFNLHNKTKSFTTETEVPTAIENTSERQSEAHVIKLTGSLVPLKATENHESEISFPAKDNHIRKTKISEKNSEVQISESPTGTHDTEATIIKTETFEEPETNESANKVSTVFKMIEKHEPIQKLEASESHQTSENRIAAVTAKPLPSKINQNFNQTTIELVDIPYIIEVHKVPDSLQTTEYQPVTHALIDATNRQDHFNLHNKTKSPNEAPTGKLLNSKKNQDHEGRQESTAVEVTENNDPIKNFSASDRSKNIEIKYKFETNETEVPTAIENTRERQAEVHVIKLTGSLVPLKETENHVSEIFFPAKDNHIRKTKISEKNSEGQISESPTEAHKTESTIIKTETFEEPETNESANKVSTVFKIIEKQTTNKTTANEAYPIVFREDARGLHTAENPNEMRTRRKHLIKIGKVPEIVETKESPTEAPIKNLLQSKKIQGLENFQTTEKPTQLPTTFETIATFSRNADNLNEATSEVEPTKKPDIFKEAKALESPTESESNEKLFARKVNEPPETSQFPKIPVGTPGAVEINEKLHIMTKPDTSHRPQYIEMRSNSKTTEKGPFTETHTDYGGHQTTDDLAEFESTKKVLPTNNSDDSKTPQASDSPTPSESNEKFLARKIHEFIETSQFPKITKGTPGAFEINQKLHIITKPDTSDRPEDIEMRSNFKTTERDPHTETQTDYRGHQTTEVLPEFESTNKFLPTNNSQDPKSSQSNETPTASESNKKLLARKIHEFLESSQFPKIQIGTPGAVETNEKLLIMTKPDTSDRPQDIKKDPLTGAHMGYVERRIMEAPTEVLAEVENTRKFLDKRVQEFLESSQFPKIPIGTPGAVEINDKFHFTRKSDTSDRPQDIQKDPLTEVHTGSGGRQISEVSTEVVPEFESTKKFLPTNNSDDSKIPQASDSPTASESNEKFLARKIHELIETSQFPKITKGTPGAFEINQKLHIITKPDTSDRPQDFEMRSNSKTTEKGPLTETPTDYGGHQTTEVLAEVDKTKKFLPTNNSDDPKSFQTSESPTPSESNEKLLTRKIHELLENSQFPKTKAETPGVVEINEKLHIMAKPDISDRPQNIKKDSLTGAHMGYVERRIMEAPTEVLAEVENTGKFLDKRIQEFLESSQFPKIPIGTPGAVEINEKFHITTKSETSDRPQDIQKDPLTEVHTGSGGRQISEVSTEVVPEFESTKKFLPANNSDDSKIPQASDSPTTSESNEKFFARKIHEFIETSQFPKIQIGTPGAVEINEKLHIMTKPDISDRPQNIKKDPLTGAHMGYVERRIMEAPTEVLAEVENTGKFLDKRIQEFLESSQFPKIPIGTPGAVEINEKFHITTKSETSDRPQDIQKDPLTEVHTGSGGRQISEVSTEVVPEFESTKKFLPANNSDDSKIPQASDSPTTSESNEKFLARKIHEFIETSQFPKIQIGTPGAVEINEKLHIMTKPDISDRPQNIKKDPLTGAHMGYVERRIMEAPTEVLAEVKNTGKFLNKRIQEFLESSQFPKIPIGAPGAVEINEKLHIRTKPDISVRPQDIKNDPLTEAHTGYEERQITEVLPEFESTKKFLPTNNSNDSKTPQASDSPTTSESNEKFLARKIHELIENSQFPKTTVETPGAVEINKKLHIMTKSDTSYRPKDIKKNPLTEAHTGYEERQITEVLPESESAKKILPTNNSQDPKSSQSSESPTASESNKQFLDRKIHEFLESSRFPKIPIGYPGAVEFNEKLDFITKADASNRPQDIKMGFNFRTTETHTDYGGRQSTDIPTEVFGDLKNFGKYLTTKISESSRTSENPSEVSVTVGSNEEFKTSNNPNYVQTVKIIENISGAPVKVKYTNEPLDYTKLEATLRAHPGESNTIGSVEYDVFNRQRPNENFEFSENILVDQSSAKDSGKVESRETKVFPDIDHLLRELDDFKFEPSAILAKIHKVDFGITHHPLPKVKFDETYFDNVA